MSNDDVYAQCELRRGRKMDVVWIPFQYAQKGRWIKIKKPDGEWENGWQVTEVYSRKTLPDLMKNERDYLKQRDASDI